MEGVTTAEEGTKAEEEDWQPLPGEEEDQETNPEEKNYLLLRRRTAGPAGSRQEKDWIEMES